MNVDNYGLNQNYKYYEIELDSLDALTSNDGGFASTDWPLFQIATPISNIAAMKYNSVLFCR